SGAPAALGLELRGVSDDGQASRRAPTARRPRGPLPSDLPCVLGVGAVRSAAGVRPRRPRSPRVGGHDPPPTSAACAALGGGAPRLGPTDDLRAGQSPRRSGAPVPTPGLPARVDHDLHPPHRLGPEVARQGLMRLRAHLGVFLVCLGLVAVWIWPLASDPAHLVHDNTDTRLFSWVMISVFRNLL